MDGIMGPVERPVVGACDGIVTTRVQSSPERLGRWPRWEQTANSTFRLRKSANGINHTEGRGDRRSRPALCRSSALGPELGFSRLVRFHFPGVGP